jgi:hypothetical protein
MKTTTVFKQQISFNVFDTQFGAQGMENIGEIYYCLAGMFLRMEIYFKM